MRHRWFWLAISVLFGALARTTNADPHGELKILGRTTIYQDPQRDPYSLTNLRGFNHAPSVVRFDNGRLMAAWFTGPHEASVHQAIVASYSDDEGQSWGPVELLQDFPRISDFDPAFIVDGRRVWFFFSAGRWTRYPWVRNEREKVGIPSFKTWCRFTDDGGKTWSEPMAIAEQGGPRNNGIRLSNKQLIVPFHEFTGKAAAVLYSSDGGTSWTRSRSVVGPAGAAEPSVAELESGRLLMVLRSRDAWLWQTYSEDQGRTWSEPEKSSLPGSASPPNLLKLNDGQLLLTHHDSPPPLRTHLTMRLSADQGNSWGQPITLDEIAPPKPEDRDYSRQVTHASTTQLPDGTIVVVWVRIILSEEEQYGIVESARVHVGKP